MKFIILLLFFLIGDSISENISLTQFKEIHNLSVSEVKSYLSDSKWKLTSSEKSSKWDVTSDIYTYGNSETSLVVVYSDKELISSAYFFLDWNHYSSLKTQLIEAQYIVSNVEEKINGTIVTYTMGDNNILLSKETISDGYSTSQLYTLLTFGSM